MEPSKWWLIGSTIEVPENVGMPTFSGTSIVLPINHHFEGSILHNELFLKFSPRLKSTCWALNWSAKSFSKFKNCFIEVYPSTDHGFAFPERNTYLKEAAEMHWKKLIHLFDKNLKK